MDLKKISELAELEHKKSWRRFFKRPQIVTSTEAQQFVYITRAANNLTQNLTLNEVNNSEILMLVSQLEHSLRSAGLNPKDAEY